MQSRIRRQLQEFQPFRKAALCIQNDRQEHWGLLGKEVSSVNMKTYTLAKEEQQILTPEQTELSKLSIDYS